MTEQQHRIVITGVRGFIGSVLARTLREQGYDVWGIDREGAPQEQVIEADMLDREKMEKAFSVIPPFFTLIHTAALAHGQRPPPGHTYLSINTQMTDNLLQMPQIHAARLISLSSVAVYGEDKRNEPVAVTADVRPASEYGISKLLNERSILSSALAHCDILRLAPVFDENHLADIRKRVYLPGCPLVKVRFIPAPQYSFCHVQTVAQFIHHLVSTPPQGKCVFHVVDSLPYAQGDLLKWFPGRSISLPVAWTTPLYWLARAIPGNLGYSVRCLYWKLFKSNVYVPGKYSAGTKDYMG